MQPGRQRALYPHCFSGGDACSEASFLNSLLRGLKSYAIKACEPCQDRKVAALSGNFYVRESALSEGLCSEDVEDGRTDSYSLNRASLEVLFCYKYQ